MNHGVSQRSQRIESGTERPNITASSIRTAHLFVRPRVSFTAERA
jgi:hypothetical protein